MKNQNGLPEQYSQSFYNYVQKKDEDVDSMMKSTFPLMIVGLVVTVLSDSGMVQALFLTCSVLILAQCIRIYRLVQKAEYFKREGKKYLSQNPEYVERLKESLFEYDLVPWAHLPRE